ncbi:hypothetical protein Slin15195_G088230 [Septoria linicola]|uniref:Uncharacterized protein n=1 Tax=Septoria linicola TaxID=215465 RepID=A0A9Q9AU82_9PEZI|nr:hypothetical protein Slin15195_G088230 [Septoria linicola]
MELRSAARLRPPRPQATAIKVTASTARKELPRIRDPSPVQSPSPVRSLPATAARPPRSGRLRPSRISPEGPPRKDVRFSPVSAANRTSPGGTTVYRQIAGMRFTKLSLFEHEQYTRYTGDEDGQRGTVDERYSAIPAGTTIRNRPAFRPALAWSPPPSNSPPRSSSPFDIRSPIRFRREDSDVDTIWSRQGRRSVLVLVCVLLTLLFANDPGHLRDRIKAFVWPPGDSDGNSSRVLVDPFGTDHIPRITDSTLSIDQFCNQMDGTGISSAILKKVSHNVQDFATWIQVMRQAREPELNILAERYDKQLTEAFVVKALAHDLEIRMCQLSSTLMDKGLESEDTRVFATKLRSYKGQAEKIRLSETATQKSNSWTAAKPKDWDYNLVDDAFHSLQDYLFHRQRLALKMYDEASSLIPPSVKFVERYAAFVHIPMYADHDRVEACEAIKARRWFSLAWHCATKSRGDLLYEDVHSGDHHRPRLWGSTMQQYLKESTDIWNDYAKHLGDGLSLLADLPKLKKDLTAEGIPARIDHLQSLFENVAKQADLTAERLQDAYERKYVVELDLNKQPIPDSLKYAPPEIGYCKGCDERAASSWTSSSASSESHWSSVLKGLPTGKTAQLMHVTQPETSRILSSPPDPTITELVKVVKVYG